MMSDVHDAADADAGAIVVVVVVVVVVAVSVSSCANRFGKLYGPVDFSGSLHSER